LLREKDNILNLLER